MEIDIMRLAKLAKLSIPEEKVEEFRKKNGRHYSDG